MKKTICIYLIIAVSVAGCKTAKNYVVSKESYEIINIVGKNLGKRKEDKLYYKTYARESPPTSDEYYDWSIYVNFNRLSQNRIPGEGRKGVNFHDYLTEADIEYMQEQAKNQHSVKWIRSRLAPNIKLYKDVKKVSLRAQALGILNMYSEPVFSIDKRIALVYVGTSGGGGGIYTLISKKIMNGIHYLLFCFIFIKLTSLLGRAICKTPKPF